MSVPKAAPRDREDRSVQVNCLLTNGEKLFLRKAIHPDILDIADDKGIPVRNREGGISLGNLEKLCETLQEETERLNTRNETLKKDIEGKDEMINDLRSQEAEFPSKEKQLNLDLKCAINQRESVLEAIKFCDINVEKLKEKLHHMEQIQRIIMEENIGIQRQWLVDKQELSSAVTDVHDRIIHGFNNLLLKENLTEDNAMKIRTAMLYFAFMNMKNCLLPQLISLELDSRELEIEQERLISRNSFIRKRIQKFERKDENENVPLRSSECSQNLLAAQLYQRLLESRRTTQQYQEIETDTRGAYSELTLSNRENTDVAVRKDKSFSSTTEKERKKYLGEYRSLKKRFPHQSFTFLKNTQKLTKPVAEADASLLIQMAEETVPN